MNKTILNLIFLFAFLSLFGGEPDFYVWQRQHTQEMQSAVREMPSWKKLLEMPPESRHFRTVWRYFMRDNYLTHDCSRWQKIKLKKNAAFV